MSCKIWKPSQFCLKCSWIALYNASKYLTPHSSRGNLAIPLSIVFIAFTANFLLNFKRCIVFCGCKTWKFDFCECSGIYTCGSRSWLPTLCTTKQNSFCYFDSWQYLYEMGFNKNYILIGLVWTTLCARLIFTENSNPKIVTHTRFGPIDLHLVVCTWLHLPSLCCLVRNLMFKKVCIILYFRSAKSTGLLKIMEFYTAQHSNHCSGCN